MLNIKQSVKGDTLILEINLKDRHGLSASGKSTVIASSQGNVTVEGSKDGVKFGLNVYVPATKS